MRSISSTLSLLCPLHRCDARTMDVLGLLSKTGGGQHFERILRAFRKRRRFEPDRRSGLWTPHVVGPRLRGWVPAWDHVLRSPMQIAQRLWKHPSCRLSSWRWSHSIGSIGSIGSTFHRSDRALRLARGRTKRILHGEMCHSPGASAVWRLWWPPDSVLSYSLYPTGTLYQACMVAETDNQTHIHDGSHPPASQHPTDIKSSRRRVVLLPFLFSFAPIPAIPACPPPHFHLVKTALSRSAGALSMVGSSDPIQGSTMTERPSYFHVTAGCLPRPSPSLPKRGSRLA